MIALMGTLPACKIISPLQLTLTRYIDVFVCVGQEVTTYLLIETTDGINVSVR